MLTLFCRLLLCSDYTNYLSFHSGTILQRQQKYRFFQPMDLPTCYFLLLVMNYSRFRVSRFFVSCLLEIIMPVCFNFTDYQLSN